jgi:hypothetical protein
MMAKEISNNVLSNRLEDSYVDTLDTLFSCNSDPICGLAWMSLSNIEIEVCVIMYGSIRNHGRLNERIKENVASTLP